MRIGRSETSPRANHSALEAAPELIAKIRSEAIEAPTFGAKNNRDTFPALFAVEMPIRL